jgi:hypothetical protein
VFRGTWQKGSKGGWGWVFTFMNISNVWVMSGVVGIYIMLAYAYDELACSINDVHASRWEVLHWGKTKFVKYEEPEAHKGQLAF